MHDPGRCSKEQEIRKARTPDPRICCVVWRRTWRGHAGTTGSPYGCFSALPKPHDNCFCSSRIGMKMAMTTVPTTTPMTESMIGSIRLVSDFTVACTC